MAISTIHQSPEIYDGEVVSFDTPSEIAPQTPDQVEIEDRKKLSERQYRDIGHIIKYEVTLADGTAYREQRCIPAKQQYDRGVTITTAWCTRIPGYNTELQRQLAGVGVASDLVGPPRPIIDKSTIKNLPHAVNLATDAAVQQELYSQAADDGIFMSEEALATGYSRGGMIIWGLTANEKSFGRTIRYFDSNDPCLVRPVRIDDVDPRELRTYTYLPREIAAAAKAIGKHLVKDILRLPQSIDVTPRGMLENIATGFALFKGQAGELLQQVPHDKVGTVRLYERSIFNHAEELYDALENHPNIQVYDRRGYHLSGISPNVRLAAVNRLLKAQKAMVDEEPLEQIDFTTRHKEKVS